MVQAANNEVCEEMTRRFGRDVYLSKTEVAVLGEVAEGDLVGFAVQLSAEGFPQAVRTERSQAAIRPHPAALDRRDYPLRPSCTPLHALLLTCATRNFTCS